MDEPRETDSGTTEMENNYMDFLDDSEDQGKYSSLVKTMIDEKKNRIIVGIDDLRRKFPKRAIGLLRNVFEEQLHFEMALKRFVGTIDSDYSKEYTEFFIGFEGSLGERHVSPRTLTSRFLGNLVSLEGIVTKCSLISLKLVKSVHYCSATNKFQEKFYSDLTSLEASPASSVYPTKDADNNPLETEFGLSVYKNHQTITIQELPEKAPPGQMPRSVDVILDNDLADKCKPGDRVIIVGGYRCLPGKKNGYTTGAFRTILIANNVTAMSKDTHEEVSAVDVQNCKKLARSHPRHKIVNLLSRSLAPSIYGHEHVKKAILLLLLGGIEKILHNGSRLRGDINILLIGDPSVAKSQLLRYVLCTAPRAIPTTGRGSSGVGLTAAVTVDQETGDKRLEAGAMVLADRGVICIDEFDKMSDIDRTAIHEVMEQGRVTIAKAGIHATLNARCSVLAAANPVYGRYDEFKSPMDNIGLQDSLLSRFDLLFVLLDKADTDMDQKISDHVVRMHIYRNPTEQDGEPLSMESNVEMLSTKFLNIDDEIDSSEIYEKYNPLLHGNLRSKSEEILTLKFMRKYIHIAKHMKPELTAEASEVIAEEYSKLRTPNLTESVHKTTPVTARTLETLIRLSTAHAKARLSKSVSVDDAKSAVELVKYAYFKTVLPKEKRNKRRNDEDDNDLEEGLSEPSNESSHKRRRRRSPTVESSSDPYAYHEDDLQVDEAVHRMTRARNRNLREEEAEQMAAQSQAVEITKERFDIFKKYLAEMFHEKRASTFPVTSVYEYIIGKCSDFSEAEIDAALAEMESKNKVMVASGQVIRI